MSEWRVTTWGSVVELQRGFDITKSEQSLAGEVPVVSSGGVSSYHDKSMAEGPGVIIGRKGTLGRVHFIESDYWPHDTTLWVKSFKDNDPKFVYYSLQQLNADHFNVGSASPTLNRNHVYAIPVLWPENIGVQRAIAGVLGALDDKIAANERLSSGVQKLLQEHFVALGLDGFSGQGSSVMIQELFEMNPRASRKIVGQVPYLEMKNLPDSAMTVNSWSTREAKGGARFVNGDVLLARITPCLENGKVGYVDFLDHEEIGIGSTEFIVFRAKDPLLSAVPFFLSKSERFRDFAIRHMQGTSGRQRLAAADVAEYQLAKVDDESLKRFGELSTTLLERVKTAVSESRSLSHTRDELLPLLMSGKITVKDAEKVVSDAV
ncbi:MAG: restriction endonuclease subunit S [Brevibacterium sp.]|nr:restriction endonuclease subunit S [Brevibacterium sp.]